MPVTLIIGAQWGDEGKGRVADVLGADADVVARYAGGDNAGHTIAVGDEVFKLHLVPSGILHEDVSCVLGNGMVINPVNLLAEMDGLRARGVDLSPERFLISSRAHIITPAHIALDRASEQALGEQAIGTTLRGIGPAYLDKTGRRGIRAGPHLETVKGQRGVLFDVLDVDGDINPVVLRQFEGARRAHLSGDHHYVVAVVSRIS